MITALRNMFASTIGKFLALSFVVLVGFAFAMGDVTGNASFGGVGGADVAKVGDTKIGVGELRTRVRRAYDQARQQQPGLTMNDFVESGGVDQVLNQMIEGAALLQYADAVGFGVSKRLIDGRIADLSVFNGVSGKFDQTRYTNFLRDNGMTETQLRDEIKLQLMLEQMIVPVGSLPKISPGLAAPYAALLMEERRGQATFIPASLWEPTTAADDATLKKYLAQNAGKYSIPERRVVQYAVFDRSAVKPPVVTDAEVAANYKANAARYAASETRRFAQVIAPDEATAKTIMAKIGAGSSLDAAARTAGLAAATTPPLSQSAYAAQTNAATAKAAFAAKKGDLIGPEQTALGWSVLRVEDVNIIPARTLAQATPEIRDELTKNKANEAIVDYYNSIQDSVNSGAALEEIAADRKLKLMETPAILPGGRAPDQSDYKMPPELAPMVGQAFQGGSEGEAQLATLVENERFAIFSVKKIIAAAPPPFAKIHDQLASDWRLAEGHKAARAKARAIVKAVEAGKSLADAARAEGPKIAPVQTIGGKRSELNRDGKAVPPELALLFSMAPNSVKTLEIPGNRGWLVLRLDDVKRPDPKKVEPGRVAAIATPLASAIGNEMAEQLLAEAKRRADVQINKDLVEQLRRELTGTAPISG